jgi:hypothetical protein
MTRKEMRAAAYEKLIEAMKLLAAAGLPLLAEEVEELALQVDLQSAQRTARQGPLSWGP